MASHNPGRDDLTQQDADGSGVHLSDEALIDQAAMLADILRSFAQRWRFRLEAGRLGSHAVGEVLRLIHEVEQAARLLEPLGEETPEPEAPAVPLQQLTEELEHSERRFRLLVDSIRDYAIYMLDSDGRIASWNVGAENLHGYRAEDILGGSLARFYTPEDVVAGKPDHNLREAAIRGRAHDEGWRVRKDGSRFWAEVVITPMRDQYGRLLGFGKVTRDVSSRRRAEETLRASEERFRLLVQQVKDYAIFLLDPHGHIVSWNEGAERIKGYSPEEILGKHFASFYTKEDLLANKPQRELEVATGEGRFEEEGWRVRKDGSLFWASVVITALWDAKGQLRGFAKVTRDLSDRKRTDDAQRFLEGATVLLAAALEYRPTLDRVARLCIPMLADWCVVDTIDQEGRIRQAATAHVDPEMEALARTLANRRAPQAGLGGGVAHVIATGRSESYPRIQDPAWVAEAIGVDPPDSVRQLGATSYMCVPLHARGRVLGAITLVRVTPGRIYGAEDMVQAEELARRAGLFIDNARLYEEAQQAIRARDEFLSVASHELKTPLASLQLQLDSLHRLLQGVRVEGLGDRLTAKMDVAVRQAERLSALVESLLDVSRLSSGPPRLELERFDLLDAAREVIERFAPEARRARCELRLRADGPTVGMWDRRQIEQVIANLLSNALKYGAGRPVEVALQQSGNRAILSVQDQGIGVPPEKLAAIFARFERAVSLRHYGGLGLGLYIASQVVKAHGGSIRVDSSPGGGSTFTVELPIDLESEGLP